MLDWLKKRLLSPIRDLFSKPKDEDAAPEDDLEEEAPPDDMTEPEPEEELPTPEPVEEEQPEPEAKPEPIVVEEEVLDFPPPSEMPDFQLPQEGDYEPKFVDPPDLWLGGGLAGGPGYVMGPQEADESILVGGDVFWAEIGASLVADSPAQNRWFYAWAEVQKSAAGYDGWTAVSGGRSGTTTSGPAYNFVEDMNTAADASSPTIQGNGVDIDGAAFPSTFDIEACPSGVIVPMYMVSGSAGPEYWFSYENGIDGTCA